MNDPQQAPASAAAAGSTSRHALLPLSRREAATAKVAAALATVLGLIALGGALGACGAFLSSIGCFDGPACLARHEQKMLFGALTALIAGAGSLVLRALARRARVLRVRS